MPFVLIDREVLDRWGKFKKSMEFGYIVDTLMAVTAVFTEEYVPGSTETESGLYARTLNRGEKIEKLRERIKEGQRYLFSVDKYGLGNPCEIIRCVFV